MKKYDSIDSGDIYFFRLQHQKLLMMLYHLNIMSYKDYTDLRLLTGIDIVHIKTYLSKVLHD